MDRGQAIARYRRLREISNRQQEAALKLVSQTTVTQIARRLGIWTSSRATNSDSDIPLIADLAVYGYSTECTPAIHRYARKMRTYDPDELFMLQALLKSRFSIWCVERRHDVAGLVLTDLIRDTETELWMMDEWLEASGPSQFLFAGRLVSPDVLSFSAGAVVPVDFGVMDELIDQLGNWCDSSIGGTADNPRFAVAVYRAAIRAGVTEGVEYRKPGDLPQQVAGDIDHPICLTPE
jgi:hypothetical protein